MGDNSDKKKHTVTYFFMRDPYMKFQNNSIRGSRLMLCTRKRDKRTNERMIERTSQKQYVPSHLPPPRPPSPPPPPPPPLHPPPPPTHTHTHYFKLGGIKKKHEQCTVQWKITLCTNILALSFYKNAISLLFLIIVDTSTDYSQTVLCY